jgi:hypothetical protein
VSAVSIRKKRQAQRTIDDLGDAVRIAFPSRFLSKKALNLSALPPTPS